VVELTTRAICTQKHNSDNRLGQGCIKGVLGVLQHPGLHFWGATIGGSGKFLCAVYN